MNNAPDPRPVFEADQVLTFYDLIAIRNGYIYQYKNTSWLKLKRRWILRTGIGVCDEMLLWLRRGKPHSHV